MSEGGHDLKPCPFCGGAAGIDDEAELAGDHLWYPVRAAVSAWNRRK